MIKFKMKFRCLLIGVVLDLYFGGSVGFKRFSFFSRVSENDNKRPVYNGFDGIHEINGIQSISSCIYNCKLDCSEVFFNGVTKTCVLSKPVGISQLMPSLRFIHLTSTASSSAEWRIFGKSQYLPVFTMKTWINAQRDCLSNGSRLTEIETVEEYDFVKNIARELNAEYVFIGGTDAFEEGNMVWWSTLQSVDPGLHHLWSPNQPDNFNNNEHCMNLIKPEDYKLNDGSCQSKYPFICERNI